jgi:hypothetical protein
MKKHIMIAVGALALTASLAAVPALADHSGRSYFGGGAGVFEDVVRDHGRRVGEGARNYGSRAKDMARRVAPIGRGISALNQSRTLLRFGAPLPLMIVPQGSTPYFPQSR